MPRTTKTEVASTHPTPVAQGNRKKKAPVAAATEQTNKAPVAAAAAAAATVATVAAAAAAAATVATATVATATVATAAGAVPPTVHVDTDKAVEEALRSATEQLERSKSLVTALRNLQRALARERKEANREMKVAVKAQGKKRRRQGGSLGGFAKPTPLSAPLCVFLGERDGTELARTEVTKRITTYIKDHNLQNPEAKKQILPDARLRALLYSKDSDEVTYFNLQRYMKIHFLRKDKETGAVSAFVAPQA